jgi:hypothetical protein
MAKKLRVPGKTKTFETQESSTFKVKNPTGFGPDKVPVTIPKGTQFKLKEVK